MKRFDNYGAVMREAFGLAVIVLDITVDEVMANVLNDVETDTTWDGLSIANANHLIGSVPGVRK